PPAKQSAAARLIGFGIGFGLATLPVAISVGSPELFQRIVAKIFYVPEHWMWATVLWASISVVVAPFLAIALHEAGHALVGVWMGFSFNLLRIGPLQADRSFRVSIYRGKRTGAGGWASMFPVKMDRLSLRAVVMLLAGPTANLLSVAAVLVLPYARG